MMEEMNGGLKVWWKEWIEITGMMEGMNREL